MLYFVFAKKEDHNFTKRQIELKKNKTALLIQFTLSDLKHKISKRVD